MKNPYHILIILISLMMFNNQATASCAYSEGLNVKDFAMGNLLNWATSKEINHKKFIIERSTDGIDYYKIGVTEPKASSAKTAYSFLDISANKGRNYYRLKEMNDDGSYQFSIVAIANMSLNNNFTVVSVSPPNADGKLEMVINSKKINEINYEIRDLENNVYYTEKQKLNDGINIVSLAIVDELLKDGRVFRIALQGEAENEILTFKSDGY